MIAKIIKNDLRIYLVLAIGLLFRIIYIIRYPVPERDSYTYKSIIETWNATNVLSVSLNVPPLGIYILNLPHSLFNIELIKGGILINIIIGLAVIYFIMRIAFLILGSRVYMLCIGILASSYPTFVRYSCQMLRENSFILFYTMSLFFLILDYYKPRKSNIFFAGMTSVLACMCRHEGIEIVLLILVYLMTRANRIRNLVLFLTSMFASAFLVSAMIDLKLSYYKIFVYKFIDRLF